MQIYYAGIYISTVLSKVNQRDTAFGPGAQADGIENFCGGHRAACDGANTR